MTEQPTEDLGGTPADAPPVARAEEPTPSAAEEPTASAAEATDPVVPVDEPTAPVPDATAPPTAPADQATAAEPEVTEPPGAPIDEPMATEPGATEPGATEPGATEPGATEPPAAPADESTDTEPQTVPLRADEPATTEPATTEPATTEPATTEPATTEPATTEPLVLEPNTAEPVTAELAVDEPEIAESVVAHALAQSPVETGVREQASAEPVPVVEVAASPAPPPPHVPTPAVIPVVHPGPGPAPVAASTADPGESEPLPESYGRVDPDGTVWVRTAAGEVQVGQFQAGSPDEAIAYYVRKYLALETEVVLLEQRLAGGADVAVDEAAATVDRITAALDTPQVVGDIDALRARVAALTPALEARRAAARAAKSRAREAAKAAREAIVVEAEGLADSTSWKSSGDRLRALLDEWKVAPRVDRGTEQALWKRFSAARNSFDRRRRAHFAKLSGEQSEAKATKTALVKEAEALSTSTDWAPTATQFRGLMDRWKAAGRASRADDDALWTRFRAAQDTFFTARSAAFDERDAGQAENLAAKEALATEAEALLPLGDLATAKTSLRDIQDRWEKVGHVPRGDKERVEGRLRRVEQAIREAEDSKWKRTNPEARARAEATVDLLTTAIAKLEKSLASATAAGDAKRVAETTEALEARRAWLDEAQRALTEFSAS